MLDLDPKFKSLPNDMKQSIMGYLARGPGRPKATPIMKLNAEEKNKMRMRLNKQAEKALRDGDFDSYIDIVEEQKARGLIGSKAYDNRVDKFISNMNKMMESQPEFDEEEYVEQKDPTLDDKVRREVA